MWAEWTSTDIVSCTTCIPVNCCPFTVNEMFVLYGPTFLNLKKWPQLSHVAAHTPFSYDVLPLMRWLKYIIYIEYLHGNICEKLGTSGTCELWTLSWAKSYSLFLISYSFIWEGHQFHLRKFGKNPSQDRVSCYKWSFIYSSYATIISTLMFSF